MAGSDYIRKVATVALSRFDQVADWLGIGGGKAQGREYLPLNPKRADTKPGSFSVNLDTGAWSDFATGDRGGDVVSLCAYLRDCKQGEAAAHLADFLGIKKPDAQKRAAGSEREAGKGKVSTAPATTRQRPESPPGDVCLMPVPPDAPPQPAAHARHGKPSHRWAYMTADGCAVNFYHDRYEAKTEGERKQFAPLTLWRTAPGRLAWQFKAPPAPRPLYGLLSLSASAAPVVLTEGEKAADAAALLLPNHPVCCWQGGAQAVSKADFSPLAGREVWLWSDADEPGERAMQAVAAALARIGAGPVKRFDLALFAATAGEADSENGKHATLTAGEPLATGDDAADLVTRGWTAAHVALIVSRPDALISCEIADTDVCTRDAKASAPPEQPSGDAPAPGRHFELTERGVMYHEPKMSPRWICAPLAIGALVRDPHNAGWGLLVNFSDPDRHPHRLIVPMQLFRGDGAEVAGLLLDRGLKIAPRARALLVEYLQTARSKERARITNRTGWHDVGPDGAVFVLPDAAIGPAGGEWIFESDSPGHAFTARGTLSGWQQEVAALCRGNSRLTFAVSVAFAAPLLYLVGSDGGGFHLRSNSSDGKTTCLRVAASVCGGRDYMQTWRNTDNALEATAMQCCDALLLLDEIAQVDARVAGECVYMLSNGGAKGRSQRTGGLRARASWRVLFLSAGEISLAAHMAEIGKTPRAGQDTRLAEIPADAGAGLGTFENLHGHKGGAELSKAITEATRKHYGGAFVAYLNELVKVQHAVADTVKEALRKFQDKCLNDQAHGQARRVADRFALVGAAGELATKWGITGWEPGEAMRAAITCFNAWKEQRGGEGNQEERAALAAVREFLNRYGESAFSDWERPANDSIKHAPVRSDRAGYRNHNAVSDATEYYIFAEVWRARVCKGFDPAAVGRMLARRGFVERGTEPARPWLVRVSLPTEGRPRVVHVLPTIFDDDGENDADGSEKASSATGGGDAD